MMCDICGKDFMFLHFVGKDNVCSKCIAKYTVFKEMKEGEEARLRQALRVFNISCFDDLKNLKYSQIDKMDSLPAKKQTFKYKKNKSSSVSQPIDDTYDPTVELDQLW